jgi:hypothetical protein
MKYIILTIISLISISTFAQEASKYEEAMAKTLATLQNAKDANSFLEVANAFERIEKNEPKEWQPIYYAAYAKTMSAFSTSGAKNVDELLTPSMDKLSKIAEEMAGKDETNPNALSEIHTLISMMYNARIMEDVMSRGPKYGALAGDHLTKALAYNASNPRTHLLLAQNLFYTPEAFGGDKQAAKAKCEEALKLFESQAGGSEKLMPSWGLLQANQLIEYISKAIE